VALRNCSAYDLDGRCCGWLKHAENWAWQHKWDIVGATATFVPVAGEIAWAYRGYRTYRVLTAGYRAYRAASDTNQALRATRLGGRVGGLVRVD
jgi:hypothetical protein